jgi:membrane fusion protein (multidrug efflux system)
MEFPPEIAVFARAPRARSRAGAAAVVAAAALAVAVAGCGSQGEAAGSPERPIVVEVMRVERGPLVDVAVFSGELAAEQSVAVQPEISGVVESVAFQQGQGVARGDVLFRLRNAEQKAKLREATATRDLARERWDRTQQLLTRDASSQAQADVAKAEFEIANARVELARLELDRTEIRAPFDGVVGLRFVDPGARVNKGTELVRIDAVDRLQVTFAISDEGLPFARPGMKVNAWVRPYPGEKFPGEVFFVSPSLDPRNRRILVKAWIDNSERRLAPGLFANVDLEIRRVADALVVPESAISIDQRGPYVWVIDASRQASRTPVEIGLRERGVVEVLHGLEEGVSVVTAGTHKVVEGRPVEISETPLVGRAPSERPEGALIGEGT